MKRARQIHCGDATIQPKHNRPLDFVDNHAHPRLSGRNAPAPRKARRWQSLDDARSHTAFITTVQSNRTRNNRNAAEWAGSLILEQGCLGQDPMTAAGLIDNPNRGRVSISERGRAVLADKPAEINVKFLKQFDGYTEFTSTKKAPAAESTNSDEESVQSKSPLELLEESFSTLRAALKDELLTRLKNGSPAFFERAVLKLLTAMGYGITGDTQLTGQPGDGGIDGVIREDKLGLDIVCVQVKRYAEAAVGRPTIQQFSGSMDGYKAKKGVILTTASFSRDAIALLIESRAKGSF